VDGWRGWDLQKKYAERARRKIVEGHPDWSKEQVEEQLWTMAPPQRYIIKFASHRYGGSVDITVVDAKGGELDMGVPIGHVTGPESKLLYYELQDDLKDEEKTFRDNRRLLIRAMQEAGFHPYLEEYWHWSYAADLIELTKQN
jgi:D-alanyl-D-alanine dipeptidase